MKIEPVKYRDGNTELTGLFVLDEARSARSAGILVVHGGAGLDQHAKRQAVRFAEQGYVVLACDLYGDGVMGDRQRVMARIVELSQDKTKLCGRVAAGLRLLRSHPLVNGRVASVGYCFGGMTVLELARSGAEIDGVVSVHGTLHSPHPAPQGTIKARILVCHGALDPHVPMTQVNDFVAEMNAANADWQLVVYGGATHGFTHEDGPHLPGVAYDAVADQRSAKAICAFLDDLFAAT